VIGVTVYDDSVWLAVDDGEPTTSVLKLDPSSLQIADTIPVGSLDNSGPQIIAAGAGLLWTDVARV
jgi:hypothetical protein